MRSISRAELSLRNGQDKKEVWVAIKGLIYDVTSSRKWETGIHYEHWAGQELDQELMDAPHLPDVINKFPIIGKLES